MALQGTLAVLYYGIFASVTGGWLPVRARNLWLVVFHLYLFLTFILFPLAVYLINPLHWAGWLVYSLFVLLSFVVMKVVNLRLHLSLGTDPIPEPEKEEGSEEGSEGEGEEKKPVKDKDTSEEATRDGKTAEELKAMEAEAEISVEGQLSLQESQENHEAQFKRHRDAASTLGQSSSLNGTRSQSLELQHVTPESEGDSDEAEGTAVKGKREEMEESSDGVLQSIGEEPMAGVPPIKTDSPELSQTSRPQNTGPLASSEHSPDVRQSSAVLMSPVHHSQSNVQNSGNVEDYINVLASLSQEGREEGGREGAVGLLQRSTSMPPSVFDNERGYPRRDRVRVCIRQNRGGSSYRSRHEGRRFSPSRSMDAVSGEEEEKEPDSLEHSYPQHRPRRNVRERRGERRTFSSDEGVRFRQPPSPHLRPSAAAAAAILLPMGEDEEEMREGRGVADAVKSKLVEEGHLALVEVADKMPGELQEAILVDSLPPSCYNNLSHRVAELRRGHLASGEEDATTGAVHWFEVSGEWDFYVFQGEGEDSPPLPHPSGSREPEDLLEGLERLHQEMLLRYGLDIEDFGLHPSSPPNPPPRPPRLAAGGEEEREAEEEDRKPTFEILPGVKRTTVSLNFARRELEEFMDRNVTWWEVSVTVVLATLVCVVAALLFNVNYYRDFWVFWFCFVVATAHFSLVKSVQDDPASPGPGQNHITALSRAVYFIVVGTLALIINAALENLEFAPLCVYGLDINNRNVLATVRDALLIFILCFPVLFALGWLPQFDTFTICLGEQIDIHIFGGTAATGLVCAIYAVVRSMLTAAVIWPLGYAAFSTLQGNQRQLTCSSTNFDPNSPGPCMVDDRVALSFFLGVLFAASFILSRSTSNHQYIWDLVVRVWRKCRLCVTKKELSLSKTDTSFTDPLEQIYFDTLRWRLLSDLLAGIFIFVFVTGLNLTTLFCLSEIPAYVIYGITCVLGVVNHYLLPHIRKEMPWLCFSEPIVKANEWDTFEVSETPKVSVIERILQVSLFLEKNIFYPLSFLYAFNLSAPHYKARFGDFGAAVAVTVVGMKLIRSAFTELSRQYLVFTFTLFFFSFDYAHLSEGLPLDFFIIAILMNKFYDLLLKMYFIYIYIAPWQTSWSSPGHIIIQPLLIPHTPVIFLQTLIGAVLSAPINPVVASTLFILSYIRPIKYWEKDYNTKRGDSSNTRLDSQLEGNLRNPNPDRLDSLFYEHLTWVLQKSLCGDLVLGKWGKVMSGDFFILTSDRLNALVHIIEFGNGFVTFQLRGLEFRGTYCHQREVEAITESVGDDEGCCCYEPGHLPLMLSCNKTFGSRWLAWEVVSSCYTLHGYSISENQAHLVFNSYEYKRSYVTYYSKCIIYKLVHSSRLRVLLGNEQIRASLEAQHALTYVDTDGLFDESRNCDYSHAAGGITRERFTSCFLPFIRVCVEQLEGVEVDSSPDSFLVTLCFAYTLLGRRMFFQHAQAGSGRRSGDNFMNGLYRMFLGDARPHSLNDEWVFSDVDSIQEIIIPAARIALKVHQDNFTFSEEYESPLGVYEAVRDVEENHIVTHENDRAWRMAVVMNKPSLLALRYQRTEDSYIYPYKLIRLNSKFIKFRVVKVNRECVRALWTSQQHELIFLRNSDSERGSIQNHKPTLRNMVNSSMDLPIGYPIYVSPLTTSYIDRHETYNTTFLGKISNPLELLKAVNVVQGWCETCVKRYRESRSQAMAKPSSASAETPEGVSEAQVQHSVSVDSLTGMQYGGEEGKPQSYEDPFPESDSDSDELLWKPMWVSKLIVITDVSQVFETFNANWLKWPDAQLAQRAIKSHWKSWRPREGMEGEVVHEWRPFHIDSAQRSHIDKVILLVKMTEDCHVLIKEQGVKEV